MQLLSAVRQIRVFPLFVAAILAAGCGQGDGKQPIAGTPAPPVVVPPANCADAVGFEDACPAVTFGDFEGGVLDIVDNPEMGADNPSEKVARMRKFAATSGATFGGSTITLATPLQVIAGSSFTMKVWSQRAVRVLFQPEPQGPGSGIELTHGGSGWEEMTFALPALAGTVEGITLIFDNGVLGNADGDAPNWTFYADDITLVPAGGGGGGGGGGTASFPQDFEGDPMAVDFGMDGGFGGGASDVIANPDASGINTSAQTARMQKFAGEVFGGSTLNLGGTVDFSGGEVFTMKVWSTRAVPVLFKFEGLDQERSVDHMGGSTWEELCFDFSGATGGPASSAITFIFDNGTNGDATNDPNNWTFYFDDIQQVASCPGGGGGGSASFPEGFEADPTTYDFGMDAGFGGGASDVIANPDASGINTSAQTARMQKFAGEVFGGSTLNLGGDVDFSAGEVFTMKVWSPRVVPVLFKFEGLDQERSVDHMGGSTWEELCFDFSGSTSGPASSAITFIFDLGVNGDAMNDATNWTFYYDDIQQVASCPGTGGGGGSFSPVTFDDANLTYALRGFGGAEDSSLQPDPTDAGNQVVRVNRAANAETFAGTVVSTGANESIDVIPLDASNTQMTVRVYSPAAGLPVRLKIENSTDAGVSVETEASTTVANAWETLTFDFTVPTTPPTADFNPAATYDKAVIFFNFGTDGATAGAQTFYFDDIDVVAGSGGGGGGGSSAVDFESGSPTFNDFGGGVAAVVANPDSSGINTSAQVGQMQKFAGETFGGSTFVLPSAVALAAGDSYKVKVRAGRSVVVTLKLEPLNMETTATHSGSGTWEELCFNFEGVSGDVTGYTLIFDNGTQGDAANNPDDWTFQFDDIVQTTESCSTGGGGGSSFAAVTFDDAALTYTLRGFGGAEGSVVTNDPAGGTNMVVQVDRAANAETFAGTVVSTGANESIDVIPLDASNTQMTVRVYSPAAGIPVRLKIENSTDAGVSVETEAMTTVANDWETLTFDFTVPTTPPTADFNPAATYDKVVIFFNFGVDGATAGAQTFYFDDIDVVSGSGGGGGGGSSFAAVTFDDAALTYALRGFGGAEDSSLQPDPTDAGNQVVRVNRAANAETFAGTVVSTGANESIDVIPLDASNTQMTVRVYSPAVGLPVRLKIENSTDAGVSVETEAMTTVADAWETLTFDFTVQTTPPTADFNPAATYDKAVIFFNFGTDGATAGAQTFYFDDIDVVAGSGGGGSGGGGTGGGGGSASAITFDDAGTTYTFRGFGGAEDTSLQADPTDAGNMVGRVNRAANAETFAGTVVSTGANESIPVLPLDGSNTTMTVRVYSPVAGIPVRLKVENSGDPTISVETEALTTAVNTWETLTFDFTVGTTPPTAAYNPAATYDKVVIFFNFGAEGSVVGAQTFYFDDIDAL